MKNSEFLSKVIMEVGESRRQRPDSKGNYKALHNSFLGMAQAMAWQPADRVRHHAIRVCAAAMRIALDGCDSIERHRDRHGLDALSSHHIDNLTATQNEPSA